jgi:hypothetical protein
MTTNAACKISRNEDWIDLYAKPFFAVGIRQGQSGPHPDQRDFSSDVGHCQRVLTTRHDPAISPSRP